MNNIIIPSDFYDVISGHNRWQWIRKMEINETIIIANGVNKSHSSVARDKIKISCKEMPNGDIAITRLT